MLVNVGRRKHPSLMTRRKIAVDFFPERGGGGPLWPTGDVGTDGRNLGLSEALCADLRAFALRWGDAWEDLSSTDAATHSAQEAELIRRVRDELPSRYYLVVE